MIRGEWWSLLDDGELRRIEDAAFHLLTKFGGEIHHEDVHSLLTASGCRVADGSPRVLFPEKLVRAALENFRLKPATTVEMPSGWSPARR